MAWPLRLVNKPCAAGLLACAAASAAAQPADRFAGLWRAGPTVDCAAGPVAEGALGIDGGVLTAPGSTCTLATPVEVREMDATLFDAVCEGAAPWGGRVMLMSGADDGLLLIWNGYAFAYERCPEIAATGTVTTADDLGITD